MATVHMSSLKKIIIVSIAAMALGACSTKSNSIDTDESAGTSSSGVPSQNSDNMVNSPDTPDNTVVSGSPDASSDQLQDAEPTAPLTEAAKKYEENIGKNLIATSCNIIENLREWVETDLELATGEILKAVNLIKSYKESAATYLADPVAVKEFQDKLDSSIEAASDLQVSLLSQDPSGLSRVPALIEGMQDADKVAKASLGIPTTPLCL